MTEKQEWEIKKKNMMIELARIENMGWDSAKISSSIFPYVLIETINILKNSRIINNPEDYAITGLHAKQMIDELLK